MGGGAVKRENHTPLQPPQRRREPGWAGAEDD